MKHIYANAYGMLALTAEQGHRMFEDVHAALQQGEQVTVHFTEMVLTGQFLGGFFAYLMEKYGFDDLTGKLVLVGPEVILDAAINAASYARRLHTDIPFRLAETAPLKGRFN